MRRISRRSLQLAGLALFVLVMAPVGFWLFERGENVDVETVPQAYLWLIRTLIEQGSAYDIKTAGGYIIYYLVEIAGISLVAFVSGAVASKLVTTVMNKGKGLGSTKAKDHVVICGWSGKGAEIIRELRAREVERPRAIVVLANLENDPTKIDDVEFFRGDPRGMVFDSISTSQFIALVFVPVSLVMLMRLSKRAGEIVLLDDLVAAVGADVARLTFLLQSLDTRQTIDLDLITAQSNENPVFYVQYANARIHSIGRRAAEAGIERAPLAEVDLSLLTHERELDVLRKLSELPEVVALACADRAPHKVTTWVRELADRFHGFYHDCYVIGDVAPELTQARLWLVEAARTGLAIGLDLLGVSAPESM